MATNPKPGSLIYGRTAAGENLPVQVNPDGTLDITVSVGGSSSNALNDGVTTSRKASVLESTAVPGTYGLVALASDGSDIAGGGGGGGGAVTIADGADVTQGAIADAKVVGDNTGTFSAKFRGLNYLLALVTDTVNARLNVYLQNTSIATSQVAASSSAITSVAGAASSTQLLAANSARLSATFYNDSSANAYLALAASASTSAFTKILMPGEYYTLPMRWTGAVYAIWASATGNMRITELS